VVVPDIPAWLRVLRDLKPAFLFGLCLACIAIGGMIEVLSSMPPVRALHPFRGWLWAAAILFFVLGIVQLLASVLRSQSAKHAVLSRFRSLSNSERLIMALCHEDQRQSVPLQLADPDAVSLVQKGLLMTPDGVNVHARACPHTVPDFVWRHMQSHPNSVWGRWERHSPEVLRALAALRDRIKRNVQEVLSPSGIGDY